MPDDWHLHLRDNAMLTETVAATARCFQRAIVMPNLVPPVTTADMAMQYRDRILAARPSGSTFEPLMTLYLTNQTSVVGIELAASSGIPAAKLYPAGATTNSDSAVDSIERLYPIFNAMSDVGMRLLVHGEVTDPATDIFDREKLFIEQYLQPIHENFPDLNIVFEHITTSDAVDFVLQANQRLAATITPQHLMMNRNDLLAGGLRPHNYCLPVLKRSTHQRRLREAAISDTTKFFLGTDSAPHTRNKKESACGCAGCYSAPGAIEFYAQIFDELGAMDKLERFASLNGPQFYGLEPNQDTLTLMRESWTMPDVITHNNEEIVPFYAGQTMHWKIKKN